MTLQELLEIQKELNSHLETTPTNEQLCWAIMAELGEFANSRKGDWCWWKRQGKEFSSESRERQLDEIADVLCFLLTGALINGEQTINPRHDYCWSKQFERLACLKNESASVLNSLFSSCFRKSYEGAILYFVFACADMSFTQAEIEAAYLKKVEVNKQRWETGEKNGGITLPQLPYKDYPVSIRVKLPPGENDIPLEVGHATIAQITKHFTQEQWDSFPVLNQHQAIQDVAKASVKVTNVSILVENDNSVVDELQ